MPIFAGTKLRAVGSALSPNGLGFADSDKHDMVSLALMDKVLEVDRVSGRARIQVTACMLAPAGACSLHEVAPQNSTHVDHSYCCGCVASVMVAPPQAGARIADVVEALRPHDLALQNIASIREQAMGGFVQVRLVQSTFLMPTCRLPAVNRLSQIT